MTTPTDHAAAILSWYGGRSCAVVERELAALKPVHALFAAADAIADAADSDDEALRGAGLAALFGGLVEPLNDGFTPAGRAVYARFFGHIAWRVASRQPALMLALNQAGIQDEVSLIARHQRLRTAPTFPTGPVRTVMVLSRVTIGADILITSLALQAAQRRWPAARVVLLGDGKLAGLFGGLPNVSVRPLSYARRGPLRERLAAWLTVVDAVRAEEADVVIAPDSRLDQLGIMPVCDESRYLLWENVQPEGAEVRSLADLYGAWLMRTLGLVGAPLLPAVRLAPVAEVQHQRMMAAFGSAPLCAVKLDHGGNPAKALPRAAEVLLIRSLRERGWRILLDRGFGAEELANSDALLTECGMAAMDVDDSGKGLGIDVAALTPQQLAAAPIVRFHGSIAGWAAACACCRLAVSYDSVGHHLAAAMGVPAVVAFTGYADAGFPIAWQPRGPVPATVVAIPTAEKNDPHRWLELLRALPLAL